MKKILFALVLSLILFSGSFAYAKTSPSFKKDKFFIYTGSKVSGVLMNNVNCVSYKKKDFEYPVLIKVNALSFNTMALSKNIFPNKDIKDLYLFGEAFGSNASERIYIRGVLLNYVLKNGHSGYKKAKFFVVDKKDNKTGIIVREIKTNFVNKRTLNKSSKLSSNINNMERDLIIKRGRKVIIIFTKNIHF